MATRITLSLDSSKLVTKCGVYGKTWIAHRIHGIITDTIGFIRAGAEDFQAAAFLSQYRNPELLEQIMNQSRSKHVMDIIRRALENRTVVDNLSIAGIG